MHYSCRVDFGTKFPTAKWGQYDHIYLYICIHYFMFSMSKSFFFFFFGVFDVLN